MSAAKVNRNTKIILLSLPLLVLAFFQEWQDYFNLWSTSYIYRHGFLVFAGTLYLLYQRRNAFEKLSISFSWLYLAIFIGLAALFLIAHSGNIKLVRMVLMPLLLIAWGSTIWGSPFIRLSGPPILLLVFGAPFWDEMSPALQWLTVAVDERMLALISIPATINEFYITIPGGTFFVDNGCSGIRYLIVALYLGAFYGSLTDSNATRTATLMAVAGFLALLSNWIRVAWIIAAGHYTNMESSLIEDHEMFGWIVFIAVTLLPFFAFTHYLDKNRKDDDRDFSKTTRKEPGDTNQTVKATLSATLTLLAIPAVLLLQTQIAQGTARAWQPSLPTTNAEEWTGPIRHAGFWDPQYKSRDIHLSGVYVSNGLFQVQLDFFGYKQQHQGKELIYYGNSVFNRALWKPVEEKSLKIDSANAWGPNQVNQLTLAHKNSDERSIVWYWYDIGGSLLTSDSEVQLKSGLKTLLGDQRAGVWILSTECKNLDSTQCKAAAARQFKSFLRAVSPEGG